MGLFWRRIEASCVEGTWSGHCDVLWHESKQISQEVEFSDGSVDSELNFELHPIVVLFDLLFFKTENDFDLRRELRVG